MNTENNPDISPSWRLAALVFLIGLFIFAVTLQMDFVYDDIRLIKDSTLLRSLKNIPQIFGADIWKLLGKESPYYRPVFITTLALDYAVWKLNPLGYHLTNIISHAAVCVVVYLVVLKMLKERTAAVATALLFALHPVHAEAVAWISARNEPLCALFMFSSFLLFIHYREKKSVVCLTVSLLLLFVALLNKEMAVTLPLLVAIFELNRGARLKDALRSCFVYATPVILYLFLRYLFLDIHSWGSHPFEWKIFTGPGIVVRYIQMMLLPLKVKVFYDLPIQKAFSVREVLVPWLLLLCAFGAVARIRKYDRDIFFGLLWFFVTMIPVSGFLAFLNPSLMAERYLYIPSLGACLVAGICFSRLLSRGGENRQKVHFVKAAGAAILVVFALLTVQRSFAWKDQKTFMTHMIADAPRTFFGHYFLAVSYLDEGLTEAAVDEFRKTLAINPLPEAHFCLGNIYAGRGDWRNAEDEYRLSVTSDQGFYKGHTNLGIAYMLQGKLAEARLQFQKALLLNPQDEVAAQNLQRIPTKE